MDGRTGFVLAPELAGAHACLGPESGRKVVGRLEMQSVGYLFYAVSRGGQKVFGPLYFQFLLVKSR